MNRSRLNVWLMAARPKTLPAAVAPVVIGTAMAVADGRLHLPSALCALLGAVLIQVGTNFANDYFDHARGTDSADRLGPTRVTQAGLIAPATMRGATGITFVLACVPGIYLVARGGWVFVGIGLVSILCGILYTGGPYPLGYLGLGDLFVLVFFGPVAVGGTYFAQALRISPEVIVAGLAPGLVSVAILTVNNLRDVEQDRRAGKKTLAVRFGRTFARLEYLGCMAAAGIAIPAACALIGGRWFSLASAVTLLAAVPTLRVVFTRTDGPSLNGALAATGRLLLLFCILFSLGWML
jgi:1,4-dihydroxy-2-naphthoate octaprenyltransferase